MQLTKSKLTNISLVVVAALGGWFAYDSVGLPTAKTAASAARTATIGSGTVMTTISSSGNVTAPNNINVNFATAGKITEIDVKLGQVVKQGEVLAKVDATAAKASLDSANAQLASAQEKLTELEGGTTAVVAQGLQLSVEQAQQQVASAQASLANAQQQVGLDNTQADTSISQAQAQLARDQASAAQDTTTLQAAVTQAETNYDNDSAQYTQDVTLYPGVTLNQQTADITTLNTDTANLNLDNAALAGDKNTLATDQTTEASACASPNETSPACTTATAKVGNDQTTITNLTNLISGLQAAVNADQTRVNNDKTVLSDAAKMASDSTAITSAQNSMATGQLRDQQTIQKDQESITNAQNNKTATAVKDQQSIKNAQQQVTNAQLSLATTENGNAQKTASPLPSDVQTDEAQVEQAQAQVATAQQTYDATTLTAPADGTIGAINDTVGETVSAGTTATGSGSTGTGSSASSSSTSGFITLTNLTDLQVVADIDEADSSKVSVDSPATVTLNAITGKEFAAHVIAIANSSTVSSNVVEYQVTFQLDNTDPAIKPGMTASVSVTTGKVDGVLNVTSSAVRTSGGTSYVLVVQPDGTQKQVDVVVGLKGDTTTEISGAIKAGDTVALPAATVPKSSSGSSTTTTTNTRLGGGTTVFGGGGGFGGGGFGGRG